jgi:Cytidylyltransferase-like
VGTTEDVRFGVYPGSFNPPTVAHLAIVEEARRVGGLDRIDLVVSQSPLGKPAVTVPSLEDRLEVLREVARNRPGLGVRLTSDQLLADIAAGADAVVLGADKWAQVVDPVWYGGSEAARDEAAARLPLVLVAPRPPFPLPSAVRGRVQPLDIAEELFEVSSTAVRAGRREWMAAEAAEFDERTGAWSNPARYLSASKLPPSG